MSTNRTVRVVNRLPQKLPVLIQNVSSRQLEHSYIPARGSKVMFADEVSGQMRSLASVGKIEIIEMN